MVLTGGLTIGDNNLYIESKNEKFDCIISNPPWGSKFSKKQKELLLAMYPDISTTETFSIALYKAIKMLSDEGILYFFLPYSFLNVKNHKNIRRIILRSISQIKIKLLGNAFKGVVSEAILLTLYKYRTGKILQEIEVETKNRKRYSINISNVVEPYYIIPATSTNRDDEILNKIFNTKHSTLLGNADFALGIVTGNNKEYILGNETDKSEPIFRGKDIIPYRFLEPACFIEFKPGSYQQVAPINYYRAKKIVYRFISDRIICALDTNGVLILNSANLFIPYKYPMETITCLFNSCIYTFIYRKKFHSTKLLKAHIQSMPLPNFTIEEHRVFYSYYLEAFKGTISQEIIDIEICKYFGLSTEEYKYIKEITDGTTK